MKTKNKKKRKKNKEESEEIKKDTQEMFEEKPQDFMKQINPQRNYLVDNQRVDVPIVTNEDNVFTSNNIDLDSFFQRKSMAINEEIDSYHEAPTLTYNTPNKMRFGSTENKETTPERFDSEKETNHGFEGYDLLDQLNMITENSNVLYGGNLFNTLQDKNMREEYDKLDRRSPSYSYNSTLNVSRKQDGLQRRKELDVELKEDVFEGEEFRESQKETQLSPTKLSTEVEVGSKTPTMEQEKTYVLKLEESYKIRDGSGNEHFIEEQKNVFSLENDSNDENSLSKIAGMDPDKVFLEASESDIPNGSQTENSIGDSVNFEQDEGIKQNTSGDNEKITNVLVDSSSPSTREKSLETKEEEREEESSEKENKTELNVDEEEKNIQNELEISNTLEDIKEKEDKNENDLFYNEDAEPNSFRKDQEMVSNKSIVEEEHSKDSEFIEVRNNNGENEEFNNPGVNNDSVIIDNDNDYVSAQDVNISEKRPKSFMDESFEKQIQGNLDTLTALLHITQESVDDVEINGSNHLENDEENTKMKLKDSERMEYKDENETADLNASVYYAQPVDKSEENIFDNTERKNSKEEDKNNEECYYTVTPSLQNKSFSQSITNSKSSREDEEEHMELVAVYDKAESKKLRKTRRIKALKKSLDESYNIPIIIPECIPFPMFSSPRKDFNVNITEDHNRQFPCHISPSITINSPLNPNFPQTPLEYSSLSPPLPHHSVIGFRRSKNGNSWTGTVRNQECKFCNSENDEGSYHENLERGINLSDINNSVDEISEAQMLDNKNNNQTISDNSREEKEGSPKGMSAYAMEFMDKINNVSTELKARSLLRKYFSYMKWRRQIMLDFESTIINIHSNRIKETIFRVWRNLTQMISHIGIGRQGRLSLAFEVVEKKHNKELLKNYFSSMHKTIIKKRILDKNQEIVIRWRMTSIMRGAFKAFISNYKERMKDKFNESYKRIKSRSPEWMEKVDKNSQTPSKELKRGYKPGFLKQFSFIEREPHIDPNHTQSNISSIISSILQSLGSESEVNNSVFDQTDKDPAHSTSIPGSDVMTLSQLNNFDELRTRFSELKHNINSKSDKE